MTWVKSLQIGDARVFSLTDGQFRLDGGAMFGTIPRALWERLTPPDAQNRIGLRINPLLIQLHGKNILIETGMDDKSGEKFETMFAVTRDETVFDGLKQVGLEASDIDLVINTHLHFDHAGRNTTVKDGKLEPTFKNARYIVSRQELRDALNTHERNRASYNAHNFEPIIEAKLFDEVDGEAEILPGLKLLPTPGHNLGQNAVVLEREGQRLVYTADLLPTSHHAAYPYIMGYDLYPVTTLQVRKQFFPQWAEQNAIICPPHDPHHAWGRLRARDKGGFEFAALEG
jgi:glyoxylase-like metal-dependent hydrolase (beta-lactamase superfamily II)